MNNLTWYSQVINFCKLSSQCNQCPYFILTDMQEGLNRPCMEKKERLLALSKWLQDSTGAPKQVLNEEVESILGQIEDEDDENYLLDEDQDK